VAAWSAAAQSALIMVSVVIPKGPLLPSVVVDGRTCAMIVKVFFLT